MPGGALLAAAGAGLSVAAILAMKQRIGSDWLATQFLPEPYSGPKDDGTTPVRPTPSTANAVVGRGTVGRGLDMNRRTRCCTQPAACTRGGRPSPCRVTPHWGVDIIAPIGTPVYAVKPGRVVHARAQGGYGYAIQLAHADGAQSTLYAHLSRMNVNAGDTVRAGQEIGQVGNSQFPASGMGAHLHFEVHPTATPHFGAARRLDPVRWLREQGIQPAAASARMASIAYPDTDTDVNVFPGITDSPEAYALADGPPSISMPPVIVMGAVAIAAGAGLLWLSGKR